MTIYFSKNTRGFYDSAIHGSSIPSDAVEITASEHAALLAAQSAGKMIVASADGSPISVDPISLLTLPEAQVRQIAELSAACAAAITAGFTSEALGATHLYPAKAHDQLNLGNSVLDSLLNAAAEGWTTPFWCADANGENWAWTEHTATQIQQVGIDGKAAILALQARNDTLARAVQAATTVEAALAITWS